MSTVAAAVMVGLIISRMPLNIWRGRVRWSLLPTNSTTTTSSHEVTKANSAPEITPGEISGRITLRNTGGRRRAEAGAGADHRLVEAGQGRRHRDHDERRRQQRVGEDDADDRCC